MSTDTPVSGVQNQEEKPTSVGRPRLLDPAQVHRRSYRAMSPSRFLDYPYAVNPAIYTYVRVRRERDRTRDRQSARDKRDRGKTEEDLEDIDDDLEHSRSVVTQPGFPPESIPYESVAGKERIDYYLDSIAQLYYKKKTPSTIALPVNKVTNQEYDVFQYPSLHYLTSPLRIPNPLDKWTPSELLTFEASITGVGRELDIVQRIVGTRSSNDVVDMYYLWKRTAHGIIWKVLGRCSRKFHRARLLGWKAAHAKMQSMKETPKPEQVPAEITHFEQESIIMALGGSVRSANRFKRLRRALRLLAAGKIPLIHGTIGNSKLSQNITRLRKLKLLRGAASAEVTQILHDQTVDTKPGNNVPSKAQKDKAALVLEIRRREASFRALTERIGLCIFSELEQERARQYHIAAQACSLVADEIAELYENNKIKEAGIAAKAHAVELLQQLHLDPVSEERVADVVAKLAVRRLWYESVRKHASVIESTSEELQALQIVQARNVDVSGGNTSSGTVGSGTAMDINAMSGTMAGMGNANAANMAASGMHPSAGIANATATTTTTSRRNKRQSAAANSIHDGLQYAGLDAMPQQPTKKRRH